MSDVATTQQQWERVAGPAALGRSLMIHPGVPVPAPWADCDRLLLTAASLNQPAVLQRVRNAFLTRTRMVYEVDPTLEKPSFGSITDQLWDIGPSFDFGAETVWRLVVQNSVDATRDGPVEWSLATSAVALGATFVDAGAGDVQLPSGERAWCDGGPLWLWPVDDPRLQGAMAVPRTSLRRDRLRPVVAPLVTAALAPDQLEAVADPAGRARIIAPAGSGKTRVLTERARHLLASGVPADALMMVAYNNRAGREMRERTSDLPQLQIVTIDALAGRIVNGNDGFAPATARREYLDERAVRSIIGQLVTFPRRANTDPAPLWISALTETRLGLRSPREVEASYGGEVEGFAEFFPRYREYLAERGLADFNEIISLAIERLLREPRARFVAERRTEVLLVDEFQDLTPAHMLLVRLLAGPTLSVFGVGDDDQTIYGFNGASPQWLVSFDDYIPEAAHHALEVNYRCPVAVTRAASNLVSHNRFRVAKTIRSGAAAVTDESTLRIVRDADQAGAVADHVSTLVSSGVAPSAIAVLTRVNVGLLPVATALASAGIALNAGDVRSLMSGSGISAVLTWLRLASDPEAMSPDDLRDAIKRPGRGVHPKVVDWLAKQSSMTELKRMQARLDEPASGKVAQFIKDLEGLGRCVERGTTVDAITYICETIGLDRALASLDATRRGHNSASNSDGTRSLLALAQQHPRPAGFERWLRTVLNGTTADEHGVVLSTVHRVKGQEWPHVVVYDVSAEVFPHRLSDDLEEERRVFHVAITRCQTSLLVTADAGAPSPFVAEMSTEWDPAAHPVRAAPVTDRRTTPGGGRRTPPTPRAVAGAVGLAFHWSGYDCVVDAVTASGVEVRLGSSYLSIPFGDVVEVGGQRVTLQETVTPEGSDSSLREVLKGWRRERSLSESVPAYVVFTDRTLTELCERRPRSTSELLQVSGIGAGKVERFGEELLAVINEALPG